MPAGDPMFVLEDQRAWGGWVVKHAEFWKEDNILRVGLARSSSPVNDCSPDPVVALFFNHFRIAWRVASGGF